MESEVNLVRATITECDLCDLAAKCTKPVPFSGDVPSPIVFLGEAPGRDEDKAGEPFIGAAGQLLRETLLELDFDPRSVAYMNSASCLSNGTPTPEQVQACAVNRELQYELLQPSVVVVLGNVALSTFRPDLKIGAVHGRVFVPADRDFWAFTTYHPAAGLRNGLYATTLKKDLARFLEILEDGDHMAAVSDDCTACPSRSTWYDADCFGWCLTHLPAEGKERLRFVHEEYRRACERLTVGSGAPPPDWNADEAANRIRIDAGFTQAALEWNDGPE
jgi:uracil-DNA glycosylase